MLETSGVLQMHPVTIVTTKPHGMAILPSSYRIPPIQVAVVLLNKSWAFLSVVS